MTNKEIARAFQELGNIMELHNENPFKIRSYENAYLTLRKLEQPLETMPPEEIGSIKGIGGAISGKIQELLSTGKMQTLERYRDQTPEGIREMLQIKGFGPKKIRVIWKELGVETIGELLYAVNENRLIELKGFGKKTQDDLLEKLEYYRLSRDKFHYSSLEVEAERLLALIGSRVPGARLSLTGALRRRDNVLESIDILLGQEGAPEDLFDQDFQYQGQDEKGRLLARSPQGLPVKIFLCPASAFGSKLFQTTASTEFLEAFLARFPGKSFRNLESEQAVFDLAGLSWIEPEMREKPWALDLAQAGSLPELITKADIRGVLHAHSTYSDGLHSLEEMARYCREQGYAYLGITDHSKSAVYANGLSVERVLLQMEEIDRLNEALAPFRIFKGIECDILSDGSLDYPDDILQRFDFIIASVHSNLRMDEAKATQRLLRAIEHPLTSILGHPTGRLLLSRQGYPIDHERIIDACAERGVAIEINANPYRLDLDWTWIPYALQRGVRIAVNPDAHSREGIHDIHFGVCSARKGGLDAAHCLNTLDSDAFAAWCASRKSAIP